MPGHLHLSWHHRPDHMAGNVTAPPVPAAITCGRAGRCSAELAVSPWVRAPPRPHCAPFADTKTPESPAAPPYNLAA